MANKAADMLKERESRREKLAKQIAELDAEIRVLREVLGGEVGSIDKRKDRKISEKWAKILCFIGEKSTATLAQIQGYADANGMVIQPDTLRSQMSIYVGSGLLSRPSDGIFSLTDTGIKKCGYKDVLS